MAAKGMGWVPDYPDIRDCKLSSDRIQQIQQRIQGLDTGELANNRIEQLTTILHELAPLLQNKDNVNASLLDTLNAEIQSEANQKINFLPAVIDEKILARGNQGEEVKILQRNLSRLGYYSHKETGYFDHFTENSVEEFQKQQRLPINGIVSAATRAELTALSSIGEKILTRDSYEKGDFGPGILYAQLQFQALQYEVNITGKLDELTEKAVIQFQESKPERFGSLTLGKGRIGQITRDLLIEEVKNKKKIVFRFYALPIPLLLFEQSTDLFFKILEKREGLEAVVQQFGTLDNIRKYLRLTARTDEDIPTLIRRRIAPLVEVVVRVTECLGGNFGSESDLEKAYTIVEQIPSDTIPNFQETAKLRSISDHLENGKGYLSSQVLQRHRVYAKGDAGPSIIFLQDRLKVLGFYEGSITGYFDDSTEEAVKRFQGSRQLDSDGSVGLETITGLKERGRDSFEFLNAFIPDSIRKTVINQLNLDITEPSDDSLNFKLLGEVNIDSDVQTLQKALCLLNLLNQEHITGNLCVNTKLAIQRFQDSRKLQIDGIVGPVTSQALKEAIKDIDQKTLDQSLKAIATVVAQIIAPLGSHADLEKAVIAGFNTFKLIAQLIKIEQGLEEFENSMPRSEKLGSWHRRFQIFMQNSRTSETAAILANTSVIHEFKPVILALLETFKSHFVISASAISAVQTIIHEIYKDLLSDLEDFGHELKDNEEIVQITQFMIGFVNPDTQIMNAGKQDQIQIQPSQSVISDRTFINIRDLTQQSLNSGLQVPINRSLHKQILKDIKSSNIYIALPQFVDLSIWCSPVEDQGSLDACTAHAGVALIEYFERRSFDTHIDASRRFLYKVTRNLMHRRGDSGASIRETMKAMVLFGVPPEEYCPYTEDNFDEDPSSFCYAFGQNYQAITYFRLDDPGVTPKELLAQIKTVLVAGFPCMFGFTLYESIHDSSNLPGHIPFPGQRDKREGGHAVVAVGYDDYKHIKNASSSGAFLIKNSWGTKWGNKGYGWLPYDYVLNGLARDWWSLMKAEWAGTGNFGLCPSIDWASNIGTGGKGRSTTLTSNSPSPSPSPRP